MLSVHRTSATEVTMKINFSTMSELAKCARKVQLKLIENYDRIEEHPALTTGKAVHKAMETWYRSPKLIRQRSTHATDQAITDLLAGLTIDISDSARLMAIASYIEVMEPLREHPDLGARSLGNVANILNDYFDHYLDEPYSLYTTDRPWTEVYFEHPLDSFATDSEFVNVIFHGTIDMILRNDENGDLYVCDHKTSSSLGADFLNRIKPNHQYSAYYWGALEHFHLPVVRFMVNGIQIAKTKHDFLRQLVHIRPDELAEFKLAALEAAKALWRAQQSGLYPMSAPDSCTMWGGCEFLQVCSSAPNVRQNILDADFQRIVRPTGKELSNAVTS